MFNYPVKFNNNIQHVTFVFIFLTRITNSTLPSAINNLMWKRTLFKRVCVEVIIF